MYIKELLSEVEDKRSELSRRLIIEYLKYISPQPNQLIDELESENSYELNNRLLHNRLVGNYSAQLSIFRLIPINYPKRMLALFNCIVYQETSMVIICEMLNIVKKEYEHEYDSFIEILIMRVGKIYDLCKDDSKFLLDLLFLLNDKIDDLGYMPLYSLEEEVITVARHIDTLELPFYELEELPDSIGLLSNLRRLHFYTCFKELPESIGRLTHLKLLDLRYTDIEQLPESIVNLQELEEFYTPEIFQRKRIPQSVITVAKKYISKKFLEKGLEHHEASIMALSEIIFSKTLNKTEIDESGHIKGLYFYGPDGQCNLARFPEFLTELEFIEELCFYNYNLFKVPKSIGKLKGLKVLDLGFNMFKNLPSSIQSLTNLETLILDYNKIVDWDFLMYVPKLKKLNLIECGIEEVPDTLWSLTSLEHLDLRWNKIAELPKDIGKLESLKVLRLNQNRLKALPQEIGQLHKLEELNLNNNYLTELPSALGTIRSLKIYLKYNQIKEIPLSLKKLQIII